MVEVGNRIEQHKSSDPRIKLKINYQSGPSIVRVLIYDVVRLSLHDDSEDLYFRIDQAIY